MVQWEGEKCQKNVSIKGGSENLFFDLKGGDGMVHSLRIQWEGCKRKGKEKYVKEFLGDGGQRIVYANIKEGELKPLAHLIKWSHIQTMIMPSVS